MEWLVWIINLGVLGWVVKRQGKIQKDINGVYAQLEAHRPRQSKLPILTEYGGRTIPTMDAKAKTTTRDSDDLPRTSRVRSAMRIKDNG